LKHMRSIKVLAMVWGVVVLGYLVKGVKQRLWRMLCIGAFRSRLSRELGTIEVRLGKCALCRASSYMTVHFSSE
jgi:hypothetical protein